MRDLRNGLERLLSKGMRCLLLAMLLALSGAAAGAVARKPSMEEARAMAEQCRPQAVALEQAKARFMIQRDGRDFFADNRTNSVESGLKMLANDLQSIVDVAATGDENLRFWLSNIRPDAARKCTGPNDGSKECAEREYWVCSAQQFGKVLGKRIALDGSIEPGKGQAAAKPKTQGDDPKAQNKAVPSKAAPKPVSDAPEAFSAADNTQRGRENMALARKAMPTRPDLIANDCVRLDTQNGLVVFKNSCREQLFVTFCYLDPKPESWAAAYDCRKPSGLKAVSPKGGGQEAANGHSGVVHWFACRDPGRSANVRFNGRRLEGTCR